MRLDGQDPSDALLSMGPVVAFLAERFRCRGVMGAIDQHCMVAPGHGLQSSWPVSRCQPVANTGVIEFPSHGLDLLQHSFGDGRIAALDVAIQTKDPVAAQGGHPGQRCSDLGASLLEDGGLSLIHI